MAAGSNSPECGGCYNCYAARQALRHAGPGGAYEGLVKLTEHGPRWTGKVPLVEFSLDAPLHVKKPCMWFVNSMSDLFHESLEFKTIARVVRVMIEGNWHTYQVLTKRAARLREFSEWYLMQHLDKLPDHVWFGVSVENQPTANDRILELLRAQLTGVRWVSYEPALGPVDWARYLHIGRCKSVGPKPEKFRCGLPEGHGPQEHSALVPTGSPWFGMAALDWLVIGGESGPGARPFDLAWARDTIAQCRAAGVPVFFKQVGSNPVDTATQGHWPLSTTWQGAFVPMLQSRKGNDMSEWPEWARVREWPVVTK